MKALNILIIITLKRWSWTEFTLLREARLSIIILMIPLLTMPMKKIAMDGTHR